MLYEFYENNELEYEQSIIVHSENSKLVITGTNVTKDGSDYYICIYLNGYMIKDYLNEDPHINRISLTSPKYLTCYRPFTKEELLWVNEQVHKYWDNIINEIDRIYNYVYDIPTEIPNISCPDYSVLETTDIVEEYVPVFYQNNIIEDKQHCIYHDDDDNPADPLFIYGTTKTLDNTDYYVCVYLNGVFRNGCLNQDPHINRISILSPRYLTCYRPFTKKELEQVNKAMHEHWDWVMTMISWVYGNEYCLDIQCPDYSVLETVD